jgi:hypothetical protein
MGGVAGCEVCRKVMRRCCGAVRGWWGSGKLVLSCANVYLVDVGGCVKGVSWRLASRGVLYCSERPGHAEGVCERG